MAVSPHYVPGGGALSRGALTPHVPHPLTTFTSSPSQDDFASLVRALETGKEATELRPDGAAAREELYGDFLTAAIPALSFPVSSCQAAISRH